MGELGGGLRGSGGAAEFFDDVVKEFTGGVAGKGERDDAFRLLGEVQEGDEAVGELVGLHRASRKPRWLCFEAVTLEGVGIDGVFDAVGKRGAKSSYASRMCGLGGQKTPSLICWTTAWVQLRADSR